VKISKDWLLKVAKISAIDADIRLEEFKKYTTLEPEQKNYKLSKIKEVWPEAEYFDIGEDEGLVGKLDDNFVVIFRGTDSLWDWVTNFLFGFQVIPYKSTGTNPKIKVHSGFLGSYILARDYIQKKFKESGLKKAFVYGHSKGGAVASLCAVDLQYNFPDADIGCATIGMPRLGNDEFKRSFEGRIPDMIRIERASDLVPQLPPELFGFRHIGNFIHVGPARKGWLGDTKDHGWGHYTEDMQKDLKDGLLS